MAACIADGKVSRHKAQAVASRKRTREALASQEESASRTHVWEVENL